MKEKMSQDKKIQDKESQDNLSQNNSSYVIFKSGSRQFRVQEGDVVDVDLLEEAEEGSTIEIQDVLFVGGNQVFVGLPAVKNYLVKCEVMGETFGPKISSIKYLPSHNRRKKFGHRQRYTRLKVMSITRSLLEKGEN